MKKKIDDDKKFYLYDSFLESYRNLATEHVKIDKIQGFSQFFFYFSSSRFFCLNSKFQVKWNVFILLYTHIYFLLTNYSKF